MDDAKRAEAIAQFKTGAAKIEADLAAVPGDHFVIMWHGSVLHENNGKIGLAVGGNNVFHHFSKAHMLEQAAQFRVTARKGGADASEIVVMAAQTALEQTKQQNKNLLAMMEPKTN